MQKIIYTCQRCGACCRWEGEVKVSAEEIRRIAGYLGIPEDQFIQSRTRLRRDRLGLALLDKPNGECEFLDGVACLIQGVKPQQCQNFPNGWNTGAEGVCKAVPDAGR